jgi:hypothetical protein
VGEDEGEAWEALNELHKEYQDGGSVGIAFEAVVSGEDGGLTDGDSGNRYYSPERSLEDAYEVVYHR